MDESSLQALWQEQPVESEVPSEVALRLTSARGPDFARPTSLFRQDDVPTRARWPLFAVFAALAALAVVVGVMKVSKPPAEDLQQLLAECRRSSSAEGGVAELDRAIAACDRVVELEPAHSEAVAALHRLKVRRRCQEHYEAAKDELSLGRLEPALERLALIDAACDSHLPRARSLAQAPLAKVKQQAGGECLAYAKDEKWDAALGRCEVYARYACQTLAPHEGPRDPVFLVFMQAREKLQPGAEWRCPELLALRPPPAPPELSAAMREELAGRFQRPELVQALIGYFQGDFEAARGPAELEQAISLYEKGNAELLSGELEKAADSFRQALAADERLVLGERALKLSAEERRRELQTRTSFIRRSIVEAMASASFEKGRDLADRRDLRGACAAWKLGAEFSRSSIDLLKALTNVCTKRAGDAFESARSCEDLRSVLDFAVEGDGFREKVDESMRAKSCR